MLPEALTLELDTVCAGFDSDLDNDLEDDGELPPAKKKKTLGQSRVASKDHSVSTMLDHFREESAQNRRDAEEERAHHRAMVSRLSPPAA